MRKPITTTRDAERWSAECPSVVSAENTSCRRFAPLLTRGAELAIATIEDELGRPLVGVFVPDGELL